MLHRDCNCYTVTQVDRRLAAREWRAVHILRRRARATVAAMSPLVALLVIACAVPLAVCQKTWECVYIQKAAQPRVFDFIQANNNTGIIRYAVKNAQLVVEDMCRKHGAVVVGVKLQICDVEAPNVTIPYEYPIWSVVVFRKKYWLHSATVDILQYCQNVVPCKKEFCTYPPVETHVDKIMSYDMVDKSIQALQEKQRCP